jgi:hypothetical protein
MNLFGTVSSTPRSTATSSNSEKQNILDSSPNIFPSRGPQSCRRVQQQTAGGWTDEVTSEGCRDQFPPGRYGARSNAVKYSRLTTSLTRLKKCR